MIQKKVVKATVESKDASGNKIDTVLFENGSVGCECDAFVAEGRCSHTKAAMKKWVSEGMFGAVIQGAPLAPTQTVQMSWRPATEDEAKRFKYVKKEALPPNVRKVPTGQTEIGKNGKKFPVMGVEVMDGDTPSKAPTVPQTFNSVPGAVVSKDSEVVGLEQILTLTSLDFYDVGDGRRVPSARVWNTWALEQGISIEIIRDKDGRPVSGCDQEKAWAAVRGTRGSVTREASVTLFWNHEWDQIVWDYLDRQRKYLASKGKPYQRGSDWDVVDGRPTVKDPEEQLRLLRTFLRLRRFGERIAVTKAEAIVQRKLLGIGWSDEEEIAEERREVSDVQALRSNQKPPTEPAPAPMAGAVDTAGMFPRETANEPKGS